MTEQDWLSLAENPEIRERIADDPYSMAYPALVTHFASFDSLNWDAAVLGLHIVYGWMPTIPKLGGIMRWGDVSRTQLVKILINAKSGNAPSPEEMETLKAFCNNSMIGASKLLHFINPKVFPIWDSRVAKVFLQNPKAGGERVNGIEPWKFYRVILSDWIQSEDVKEMCKNLRTLACFLTDASDLRLVELVMFHKTASKRKQGK